MKDYNSQILNYWEQYENNIILEGYTPLWDIIIESMKMLKFGCPVNSDEELAEVLKICQLYYDINYNQDTITNLFRKNAEAFDISFSLTKQCGNGCLHCSTNASISKRNISAPFSLLKTALAEMRPQTRILYISCEGDPFYYKSNDKTIIEIIKLLQDLKYQKISFQSMPPTKDGIKQLERIIQVINKSKGKVQFFLPQISFNFYTTRSGVSLNNRTDHDGSNYKECFFPPIDKNEIYQWVLEIINNIPTQSDINFEELSNKYKMLRTFLHDFISTVLLYASANFPINFELRGDKYSEFTGLKNTQTIFNLIMNTLIEHFPDLNFKYTVDAAYIIPLGRATNLFPNGRIQEKNLFDKHIQMNSLSYLCDNWMQWNSMTIDTKGYPQLCYSNLALSPIARTISGPNLYKDGFETICDFYVNVFEDRLHFLKENLPKLVSVRPNNYYCPLNLFKNTLQKYLK